MPTGCTIGGAWVYTGGVVWGRLSRVAVSHDTVPVRRAGCHGGVAKAVARLTFSAVSATPSGETPGTDATRTTDGVTVTQPSLLLSKATLS